MMSRSMMLLALLCCSLQTMAEPELKVAFVYQHPVSAGGWSLTHDLGRQGVLETFGDRVEATSVEGIMPGPDTVRILTRLAREGHDMIFATSFGHMNGVMRVAPRHPKTAFEHASGYKRAANVGTYQIRAYEGRYLSGILAGRMSKDGRLGFVAAFPIPEVVRGINAFVLGARSVRSDATLQVIWINTWMDPSRSREAAELLIDQGVDVVTHHTESASIVVAAEQRGVWSIGYQHDRSAAGPTTHLATVAHNWAPIYSQKITAKLEGTWTSGDAWLGLSADATRLEGLLPDIPEAVLAEVSAARQRVIDGQDVFSGPLTDTEGSLRIAEGESMTDEALLQMEWFVEGVLQAQ